MRIRKRLPPPPSSSPLSDPHLYRSAAAAQPYSDSPKHHPFQIIHNGTWVFPKTDSSTQQRMKQQKEEFADDEKWKEEEKKKRSTIGNDIRRIINISDGEEGTNKFLHPSSSTIGDYKVVPLKKRKGCFNKIPNDETVCTKMKSKTNKKCDDHNKIQIDEKTVIEKNEISNDSCSSFPKRSKRGNVIMEGSRCSRVNGRGWRCCQSTLVGYSLCEHHLGKGRLRSNGRDTNGAPLPSCGESLKLQPLMVTKKRTKVGVVKARSISSLLSQI